MRSQKKKPCLIAFQQISPQHSKKESPTCNKIEIQQKWSKIVATATLERRSSSYSGKIPWCSKKIFKSDVPSIVLKEDYRRVGPTLIEIQMHSVGCQLQQGAIVMVLILSRNIRKGARLKGKSQKRKVVDVPEQSGISVKLGPTNQQKRWSSLWIDSRSMGETYSAGLRHKYCVDLDWNEEKLPSFCSNV